MASFVSIAMIHLALILGRINRPETKILFEKKTTAATLNYVKNVFFNQFGKTNIASVVQSSTVSIVFS